MRKKLLATMIVMLMGATMFAGMATVIADDECIKDDEIEWVTIYVKPDMNTLADSGGERGTEPYTDLSIYLIQIGHSIGNSWRVKYYLEVEDDFTGTFYDRLWIDDDIIEDHSHSSEYMETGINGPYYSRWFPVDGKGYHDVAVYTDYYPGRMPIGRIPEFNEYNNEEIISYYFSWIG
jgi:hypothetical protein